jgi:hypothetical protein
MLAVFGNYALKLLRLQLDLIQALDHGALRIEGADHLVD